MRPIDADRLSLVLQKNFEDMGGVAVLQQIIDVQPTLDAIPQEQCPDIRGVIDGLKDLIEDRKSFTQEPDDIFSRDIQILEQAVKCIQSKIGETHEEQEGKRHEAD